MNVVSEVGRPLAGHALSLLKSYKVWKNLNFAEKIKFVEVTDASLKRPPCAANLLLQPTYLAGPTFK